MSNKYERAKNLDDATIETITRVLDGWSGKLTWELLVDAVEKRLKQRYTRQALNNHARIAEAFRLRKKTLTGAAERPSRRKSADRSQELEAALQRIEVLEAENQRLSAENRRFLEQFARWVYNASTRNLDKDFLDQPLPQVQRDRTQVTMEELTRRSR